MRKLRKGEGYGLFYRLDFFENRADHPMNFSRIQGRLLIGRKNTKNPRTVLLFPRTAAKSAFKVLSRLFQIREHKTELREELSKNLKLIVLMTRFSLKDLFFKTTKSKSILCGIGLICFMLFNLSDAWAQPALPRAAERQAEIKSLVVGQKVPDEFWTKEHLFYIEGDTIRKTLEEYRGKLLVLDFWFSGCLKCLLHQEEINHFETKYPQDLKVVRVNSIQSRENYTKLDHYFKSERFLRLGLTSFDSIIEDDYLYGLFAVSAYPNYFWINKDGILQLQTFRNLLDRAYQAPFIDNEL